MREYSKLFTTVYDADANGVLREFSILRALVAGPREHLVCVLWDSDRDKRVIEILEDLYLAGRLHEFIGIAEHKAHVILYAAHAQVKPVEGQVHMSDGDFFQLRTDAVCEPLISIKQLWGLGSRDIQPRQLPQGELLFAEEREALRAQATAIGLCKADSRVSGPWLRMHIAAYENAKVYK